MKLTTALAGAGLFAAALPALAADAPAVPPEVAQSVLSAMDPKAAPCTDFYQYACGTWLAAFGAAKVDPFDRTVWTQRQLTSALLCRSPGSPDLRGARSRGSGARWGDGGAG